MGLKVLVTRVPDALLTATVVFDGKGGVTVSGTGEVPESEKGAHKISDLPEPAGFVFLREG